MKKLPLIYLLVLSVSLTLINNVSAQSVIAINHIALYVNDLQTSATFYKNVMQLQEIPEPFKDGKHVWFRIGPHSQLHVIQGGKIEEHDINTHTAFSVKNLKKFTDHLDKANVHYGNWKGDEKQTTARPDGVQQVYFQDPNKFWIEVNDDKF